MASTVGALYSAEVFALLDQRFVNGSTSTEWADVFARRDRHRSAFSIPEPHRIPVRLSIEGEPVEFIYTTFEVGLPTWAGRVLQSLAERWGARPGWDSYQAKPTSPQLVVKLLNILSDLMQQGFTAPQITPLADSGVQAEWHDEVLDLEVVISADQEPTFYCFNRTTNEQEEGDLGSYSRVRDLIRHFS